MQRPLGVGRTVGLDGTDVDGSGKGVKGGKWFSLIDKVYAPANLRRGLRASEGQRRSGRSGSPDDRDVRAATWSRTWNSSSAQLQDGSYRPQAVRREWIPKPGSREKRPLGIPTVRDRVVQTALRHVLEPIFERDFAEHSYGFRPGEAARMRCDESTNC